MRTKRRKVPVTAAATIGTNEASASSSDKPKHVVGKGSSASPAASARVIRRFHVLLKRKAQFQRFQESSSEPKWKEELRKLDAEMEEMGGLAAYQRMSTVGQDKDRGGGSEGVLIGWLDELGVRKEASRCVERGYPKMRYFFLSSRNYLTTEGVSWVLGDQASRSGRVEA